MDRKLSGDLQERCIEARITKLEGALLKKVREVYYGQVTLVIHKIEGQPIRIETTSNHSEILSAKDGLDLEDSVYINNFNTK